MILHSDNPRRENDFYPTPYGLCRASIDALPEGFIPKIVIDPGCGTGRWGKVLKEKFKDSWIMGVDINDEIERIEEYSNYFFYDYTKIKAWNVIPNLIIGNPPYKFAEEFVLKSFSYLDDGGYLMFVLRLGFLESESRRKGLWKKFPPRKVLVCGRRPSFNTPKDRKTDGTAYAVFLWQKGWKGITNLDWLEWKYDKDLDYED
jgi:hypothetical protein